MNKFFKSLVITAFLFIIIPENAFAQGPPPWAPAHGYRAKTRNIYFPDQNVYYDLEKRDYIFLERGIWIRKPQLPRILIGINLGGSPQIELDFSGSNPYRYNHEHVHKYKGKKHRDIKKHNVEIIKIYDRHDDDYDHDGNHGHGKGHGKH